MNNNFLEHINLTVSDPDRVAALLSAIFGWKRRWAGEAIDGGRTVHVGIPEAGNSYLALYTNSGLREDQARGHNTIANLNHIGVVVSDLEKIEQKVLGKSLEPFNHAQYAPGRRFYFYIDDGIEIEVISYT
ncbi:MAG: VOC family protein [Gammaproteobacteria bacterium]|nr:VOC family protein [Gammaproteobacteria bacterium]